MYMGYVEYNIVYRRGPQDSEVFSETTQFMDIHQMEMLTSIHALEAMKDLYGADEVHLVGVYMNGQELEDLIG